MGSLGKQKFHEVKLLSFLILQSLMLLLYHIVDNI